VSFPPVIFETEILTHPTPPEMDARWRTGWRHFGREFFRYSISLNEDGSWHRIQPLRMVLADFQPTARHRRILKKNADLTLESGPAQRNEAREAMFRRHRERFKSNIPDSLAVFLPEADPATQPCECREFRLLDGDRLLAVSYLDCGAEACSSVYAMFEPTASARSLGLCTFLHEIAYAQSTGRRYLYPGYATVEPSHYDYKKTFPALETWNWRTSTWQPLKDPDPDQPRSNP
jgi:leucyl-tRNA---protein transferase